MLPMCIDKKPQSNTKCQQILDYVSLTPYFTACGYLCLMKIGNNNNSAKINAICIILASFRCFQWVHVCPLLLTILQFVISAFEKKYAILMQFKLASISSSSDMQEQKHSQGDYYSMDWTTGLEYWTHILLVFTHSVVTFVMSLLTKCLHGTFYPLLNKLLWGPQYDPSDFIACMEFDSWWLKNV